MSPLIFVAGHRGMVGSAIVRRLAARGRSTILTRSRSQLDLTDQQAVTRFFAAERIDSVYLAAAKVGGIWANNAFPADFIYQNLIIQANIIHAAFQAGIKKLLFLGSSCIYPKAAPQPIAETALLTGPLEPTNEPYAIAKIAGIKLCESYNRQYGTDFRSVMPTNLYGPHDNFDLETSHVIPAMMRRFHEAKISGADQVTVWGTGTPRREFLHVDDLAAACVYVMSLDPDVFAAATHPMQCHLNVGTGRDCTIRELAERMAEVVGFEGRIAFDTQKPDGTPRKRLDVTKLNQLGWRPIIELAHGLRQTYAWYLAHVALD